MKLINYYYTLMSPLVAFLGLVLLPVAVIHFRKIVTVNRQIFQVLGEVQQFAILVAIEVRLPERPYSESVLRVHDEIAAYIVEHYRILAGVLLKFTPNHA